MYTIKIIYKEISNICIERQPLSLYKTYHFVCVILYIKLDFKQHIINIQIKLSKIIYGKFPDYRPPPNTDPLLYLSNYKRYKKIIYTRNVSNLIINMNTYFVFKNM